ncbi:atypical chemokine receptor 2 [Hypomesus transpacificus]|uniref:atypical chemokine receptor 2 n=1 Tax=Hypomesus transpacificus TaxID=137520 RepID=UPI001F078FB2|nr:atypical chemokine receptor 2 [Hypomesus transpacificus]
MLQGKTTMELIETSSSIDDTYFDVDYDYSYYYDYMNGFWPCENTQGEAFGRNFLVLAESIICLLSIIGNMLFIFSSVKSKLPQKILPMSITMSSILFTITLPFYAIYAHSEWIFGNIVCKTVTAIHTATMYSSILFTICLGLEIYLGVKWNLSGRTHSSPVRLPIVCSVIWILSSLAAVPSWTFVEEIDSNGQKLCSYNFGEDHHTWMIFKKFQLNIFGFLVPFSILLFCYMRVCCAITKLTPRGKSSAHKLLVVVVVFFVLWFPYNCVLFLHSVQIWQAWSCDSNHNLEFAIQITECIAFSHSFINPIVYGYVNRRVWRCFARMCVGRCQTATEYTLEGTNSTDFSSVHGDGVELKAVQCHHQNTANELHKATESLS